MAYIPAHQRPVLERVYVPRRFADMRINYHDLTILQKPTITIRVGDRMRIAWTLVWDDFKPQLSLLLRHTDLYDPVQQFQHHYEGYSSSRAALWRGAGNTSAQDAQIRNLSYHLVQMNDTLDYVIRHGIYSYINKLLPGPYQHLDKKLWAKLTELEQRHGVLITGEVNLEELSRQVDREREEAEARYAAQLLEDQHAQQVLNWVAEDHGWGEAPPNDENVPPPPQYSPRHTPPSTPPLDAINVPLGNLPDGHVTIREAVRILQGDRPDLAPLAEYLILRNLAEGGPDVHPAAQAAAQIALDLGADRFPAPLENGALTEGESSPDPVPGPEQTRKAADHWIALPAYPDTATGGGRSSSSFPDPRLPASLIPDPLLGSRLPVALPPAPVDAGALCFDNGHW
ncbi:hypothetical protein CERSUDRAFT_76900 [Gelatoporia subvermispora B]|uniref:Uncharacterized protein n=1 Tax=Ceriporiopsis subvermispora (strain B) TaxID=914234 RepID=M2R2U7_CERS8|nr:hypothetical protein CERSUDRAFT_76900 [Gelatoporia subvermispora B]